MRWPFSVHSTATGRLAMFAPAAHLLPDVEMRRARHIVTEDVRVNRFVEASQAGDLAEVQRLPLGQFVAYNRLSGGKLKSRIF